MQNNRIDYVLDLKGEKKVVAGLGRVATASQAAVNKINNTSGAARSNASEMEKMGKATRGAATEAGRAASAQGRYFAHIARTTIQSALINKLFLEFVDVSGQAIKQVDLMNNFPATMAAMGQSTDEAATAMETLTQYVGQIGGNLGQATSYITRFTGATQNVKAATAIFIGLNNALIAGDSAMEEQRQTTIQFAQALERGRPDAREWRKFTETMSFQMAQVAEAMGYVNANELGEALTQGEESMADFTSELTKLATSGPIADQALTRMQGMQFAFNVMKNTMVRGMAAIIDAFGRSNIVSFFNFLTQVITVASQAVVRLITLIGTLINFISRLFGGGNVFGGLGEDVEGVADGLGTGAGSAEDMADGIDGAGKAAKKLNKQLAGFDKMNVLADKEPAGGGGGRKQPGIPAGFDADQIGEFEGLFDGLENHMQEVSKWAKIFAGVLGGIAALKFAQGLVNQIDGIGRSFRKAGNQVNGFKRTFVGGIDESGKQVDGLKQKLQRMPVVIGGGFGKLGALMKNPFVIAAVAVVALIGWFVSLYNTNEDFKKGFDSVWGGIGAVISGVADIFKAIMQPAIEQLKDAWDGLLEAIEPITVRLQPLIDKFKEWLSNLFPGITGMEALGKAVGIVAAVIAGIVGGALALFIGAIVTLTTGIIWLITKIIEIGTVIATYIGENFTTAKDAVVDFVTGGIDIITGAFDTAKEAVTTFISDGIDKVKEKFDDFKQWIEDNEQALINWGIVIATIVAPKIALIGIEFAKAAAAAIINFATIVATSVTSAAKTVAAWVTKELPRIIKSFVGVSKSATIEFAKTSAAAVKNFIIMSARAAVHAARITASFVLSSLKTTASFGLMVIKFIAGLALMAAKLAITAVKMAASWLLAMGPWGAVIAIVMGAIALIIANWDTVRDFVIGVWESVKEAVDKAIEFIKNIWGEVVGFFKGVRDGIFKIFLRVVDFYKDVFQKAWNGVKAIWDKVVNFFQGVWDGVVNIFSVVINFYKDIFQRAWDKVKAIWGVLGDWFKQRWENVKTNLSKVGTWFKETFQKAWENITSVFSGVAGWFRERFRQGWDAIKGVFSKVKTWFQTNVVDKILDTFKGIKGRITDFFGGVWDGVSKGLKDALNRVLSLPLKIPSVSVAGKTIGGQTLIPRLARGGIIDQATLAVVGEDGAEAVVPLENNLEWIDKLASKINTSSRGDGQPIQLTVQIGEEQIANKVIELINEKTNMSGRNTILV